MDFKKGTDGLFARISHDDLASILGVSVASIRQARLSSGAKAYREPPKDWQFAVIRLAEKDIMQKRGLIEKIREGLT